MIEHKIIDNFYYVYNEDGVVVFSLELTNLPGDQVIIKTDTTVYSGPISLLDIG